MVKISTVSLSQSGVALILAEQEINNLALERVRLLSRCREADEALRLNTASINEWHCRVEQIKRDLSA